MMRGNEDRTLKNRKTRRALTGEFITTNYDRIFGNTRDSIIVEFVSPVDAVMTTTKFQRN